MAFSLSVVDRILAAYVINGGAGTDADVLPAKASIAKEKPPLTICYCHTGSPLPEAPHSGNLLVDAYVEIRTRGILDGAEGSSGPRDRAEDRADKTFALFRATDDNSGEGLADAINAARGSEQATIQWAKVKEVSQGFNPVHPNRTLGNIWVDCIILEMLVSPGDTA